MEKETRRQRYTAGLLRKRDRQAWQEFYQSTITRVYNFAYYKLQRDHHSAEEVTQEVYLSAYSSIALYEYKGALEDWLIGIARRRVADYLRNMKRHGGKAVEAARRHDGGNDLPPDEHLARRELADSINVAVAELPANYAVLLKLKYMAKKSVREICSEVGSTEKAVESMLFRARQALRRSLEASVGTPAVAALIGPENLFEAAIGTILEGAYKPVAPSETFVRALGEKIFSTVKGGGKVVSAERVAWSLSRNTAKILIVSGIVAALVVLCCLLVILNANGTEVPRIGLSAPERTVPVALGNGEEAKPADKGAKKPEGAGEKQPGEKTEPKKPAQKEPDDKPAEKPEEKSATWSVDMGIDALCRDAEVVVIAKYNGPMRATGRQGSRHVDMFSVEQVLNGDAGHDLSLLQWMNYGKERTFFTRPKSLDGRYIIFIKHKENISKAVEGNVVLIPATKKNVDKVEKSPWFDNADKASLMLDLTAAGPGYEWMFKTQTYEMGMEVGQSLTVQGSNLFPTWKFKEAKITAGNGVVEVEKKEAKDKDRYIVVVKAVKKGDAIVEFRHNTAPEPDTGKVVHPKIAAVVKIKVGKQQATKKVRQGELKFPGFEGASDDDPRFGNEGAWKSKLYPATRVDVMKWLTEAKDVIKSGHEKGDNLTQVHLIAAMCYQALGEKDKAVEHYEKVVDCLDPGWRVGKTNLYFEKSVDKLRKVIEGRIQELSQR